MNIKLLILAFIGVCFFTGAWQLPLVAMEKELNNNQQKITNVSENPSKICEKLIDWALEKFFKSWAEHQKQAGLKEFVGNIKHIKSYYIGQREQYFYEAIFNCCTSVQFFCIEEPAMKYLLSDVTFLHAISIQDLATFVKKTKECKFAFRQYWLFHKKVKKLLSSEDKFADKDQKINNWKSQLHMSIDSDAYSSVYSDTEDLKKDFDETDFFENLFDNEKIVQKS